MNETLRVTYTAQKMAAKDVITGVLKLAEKTSGRDRICRFAARVSSPSDALLPPPFLQSRLPLQFAGWCSMAPGLCTG